VINPALYGNLGFDTAKDFTAISSVVSSPLILVVGPAMPVNSVQELIAALKQKKGDANYSSAGNGNLTHLAAELFKSKTGVEMVHIPFNGGGPAITEVVAGRVALYFSGLPPALPQIAAGKLKALAVTTAKRSPSVPDIPTMMEAGVPDYEIDLWYGLLGPAHMPAALVTKINADVAKVISRPEVVQRLAQLGVTPNPSTPAEFQARIDGELKKWAVEVPRIGIKLQ
jgi:tripartite-type tricarboxylate transporter receptor subunit TctC